MQKAFNKGGNDLYSMLKDQVEGRTDTWDLQWAWHVFKQKGYFVYSRYCFQENKGFDGSGRHCGNNDNIQSYFAPMYSQPNLQISCDPLEPDSIILRRFKDYHNKNISYINEGTFTSKIAKKIKRIRLILNQA